MPFKHIFRWPLHAKCLYMCLAVDLGPLLVQLLFRKDQPFFRSAMLLDIKPSGRNPNEMTLQEEAAFV
jgi:hypothetical protein